MIGLFQGEAIVSGIGAAAFLVGAIALVYEAFALWTGKAEPITAVTRGAIQRHHVIALAITGFVLILVGHFWR